MNSQLFHTEAIVLQAIPFQEYDQILTLFSPSGIFKVFFKKRGHDIFRLNALSAPLTLGDYILIHGRSDLLRFRDGTILKQHIGLRSQVERLEAARKFIEALLCSQWIGKPAPQLYFLFKQFLVALEKTSFPQQLVAPFLLKVLKHEGILQLKETCISCNEPGLFRYKGEKYCAQHRSNNSLAFSEKEEHLLVQLASCRTLSEMIQLPQEEDWKNKIDILFRDVYSESVM